MKEEVSLHVYPLFTGMTRPAMFMGVPLSFFILALFPCIAFYVVSGTFFITLLFFSVMYVLGFLASRQEAYFMPILLGRLTIQCPNKTYWNCYSYEPY